MHRRTFLQRTTLGAAALCFPHLIRAKEAATPPPYAEKVPRTPFDAPPGSWTLAVLPDTQNMAESYPAVFDRQCEWIAAHQQSHNILFVAHEGDITNHNVPVEWENARKSLSILNRAGVPYGLVPGNHDIGSEGHLGQDRATLLNDYFTDKDFSASAAHGLFEPGKVQNAWHHINTPAGKYLLVGLEYGPRDAAAAWARETIRQHADRQAILLTHAYLYYDSTRYDWAKYGRDQKWDPKGSQTLVADGGVNDGQDLWDKVIAPSSNVILTLNGHVLNNGTGHLISPAADGHQVHQILANYQAAVQIDDGTLTSPPEPDAKGQPKKRSRPFGGGGFIRLMRFHPDGTVCSIRSYSPWYDRFLRQPDQQFEIRFGRA